MGVPQSHFQLPILEQFQERTRSSEFHHDTLKVMTWNILAERLVTQSHFPYVKPRHLDYLYRIDITVPINLTQKRLIERMDCAILALQEVDPTNSFFQFLSSMGYDYHFRPKGCFQGILIAYKRDQFKLIQSRVIDYDKMISPRCKRFPYATGHGALLLKVRPWLMQLLFRDKYKLIVGNTHLHWVPRHYKVKYHQTCSALNEMANLAQDDPDAIKLLMGDFNSLPDCNAIRLVTTNQPPVDHDQYDENTYRDMLLKYQENQHRLVKMTSVYGTEDMPYTNVTADFKGTIDYMFYEESPKVQVNSLLTLKDSDAVLSETALPNSVFPSDHLPLICTFGLRSE